MPHTTIHQATISYGFGGDEPIWEGELTVEFTYTPGFPGCGPDFESPGEPPEPDEIDIVRVLEIDGAKPTQAEADAMKDRIYDDDRVYRELCQHAELELADRECEARSLSDREEDRRFFDQMEDD